MINLPTPRLVINCYEDDNVYTPATAEGVNYPLCKTILEFYRQLNSLYDTFYIVNIQ